MPCSFTKYPRLDDSGAGLSRISLTAVATTSAPAAAIHWPRSCRDSHGPTGTSRIETIAFCFFRNLTNAARAAFTPASFAASDPNATMTRRPSCAIFSVEVGDRTLLDLGLATVRAVEHPRLSPTPGAAYSDR